MIGHSIGEYTAACISGVMNLKDAIQLICVRAKLMAKVFKGSMLSILLSEEEIIPLLDEDLSLSVINSPNNCVVSGNCFAINKLEKKLNENEINNNI